MTTLSTNVQKWKQERIKYDEINRFLEGGEDFINEDLINQQLNNNRAPDAKRIDDILAKSRTITTLNPDETAALINVTDPEVLNKMYVTAGEIKKKVYDNRIVTFAPLYTGNECVNNCLYCAFRSGNTAVKRRVLTIDEVKRETEILVGEIGHKRLIVVYGEHPTTDIDYMVDTIKAIYSIHIKRNNHELNIRRVNVNAAPMEVSSLKRLKEVGIGTIQVFQETYHKETYAKVHPNMSLKGDYRWRLYCMHRALEAGIDDVGIGALFGLYDWQFEVMGLLYHSRDLEKRFNVGPHTISFPRLEPATNTPFIQNNSHEVSNNDFKKLVAILRLSVPHTGLILTAREDAGMRRECIPLGCTQTDASTKIGIGAYSELRNDQTEEKQQFILGDTRSLDEVVRELAKMGFITSFCTAGYRCGRTGEHIMDMLRSGKEGCFCKLNAIITFREWLDDFATDETKAIGEALIKKELAEVKSKYPANYDNLIAFYTRTVKGDRDLYF